MTTQTEEITVDGVTIAVIRSTQRQRTISLELHQGRYLLRAPAALSGEELTRLASRLIERHQHRQRRQHLNSDDQLRRRADELNQRYFKGQLRLASIRYVTNQRRTYGSCTPSQATIRISDQVAGLPEWVRDYILVHELAHLVEANHGPRFWALVNQYPLTERARGYLMALGLSESDEGETATADGEAATADGEAAAADGESDRG